MRLTTALYDGLQAKQVASPAVGAGTATAPFGGGAADIGTAGGDAVTHSIVDYLDQFGSKEARAWRSKNIWCDIAIRRRMDALRDQEWTIGAINSKEPYDAEVADAITRSLDSPNEYLENNTFGGLWGAGMDDTYTVGYGVIQLKLNRNLTPRGYRALDAANFYQNPKWKPGTGDKPSTDTTDETKRWYLQDGTRKVYFSSAEIVLLVPYMSTHDKTGLSPMKSLRSILQAELDTRRNMHGTQKFRIPPGVFIMPGAAPGSPERMRLMWDIKMAGRFAPAFMNLPKDSKWVEFGGINLMAQGTFQFYEILVRATAAAFGTTPFLLGWTDQDNRANSMTQLTIADRGETAMLKFVRQVINRQIIPRWTQAAFNTKNIGFNFRSLIDEDELEDAQSLRTKAGPIGFIALNEVRGLAGLTEYSEKDLGPALWPFVADPWVPTRFPGIMLPLRYAAMTWGLDVPGVDPVEMMMAATGRGTVAEPAATGGTAQPTEDGSTPSDGEAVASEAAKLFSGLLTAGATDGQVRRIGEILAGH